MEKKEINFPDSGEWVEYRRLILWEMHRLGALANRMEEGMDANDRRSCEMLGEIKDLKKSVDQYHENEKTKEVRLIKVENDLLELKTKAATWGSLIGFLSAILFEVVRIFIH